MSQPEQLYRLDTSDPCICSALVNLLKLYVPYSLPLLGSLASDAQTDRQVSPALLVHVWASFQFPLVGNASIPEIFCIILLSTLSDRQCTLFCSEDASPLPPTPTHEAHVMNVIRSFLALPGEEYGRLLHSGAKERRVLTYGSVHSKWTQCIEPYTLKISRYITYLCERTDDRTVTSVPEGMLLSQLCESDVEVVMEESSVGRTREYFVSRFPTSICMRTHHSHKPVAWALMHANGSIGTLHVEPEFRRKGLGQLVMRELVNRFANREGWNWVDVHENNTAAVRFFDSLTDWNAGWTCMWIFVPFSN